MSDNDKRVMKGQGLHGQVEFTGLNRRDSYFQCSQADLEASAEMEAKRNPNPYDSIQVLRDFVKWCESRQVPCGSELQSLQHRAEYAIKLQK